MAKLNTVAIVHPNCPGERITMNERDFDPTIHVPWAEPTSAPDAPTETIDLPEPEPTGTLETIDLPAATSPAPTIEEIGNMGWRAIKAYCESIGLEGKGEEPWEEFLTRHLYPAD